MLNYHKAENGKVFKSKITNDILGYELYLAKSDTIDNYEQIDIPTEEPAEQNPLL